MTFLLKTYSVSVDGFPPYDYEGATPAQAQVKAWHAYCSYRYVTFREFLKISTIRRGVDSEGFGRPIVVSGDPAYFVGGDVQRGYVRFVRPGETQVLLSHPLDVAEICIETSDSEAT